MTPAPRDTAAASVILPDRAKTVCYVLGPVLLTGHNIDRASTHYDSAVNSWVVQAHFSNDDFVTKIAAPHAAQTIAIVFDHTVLSAPKLNPGITGRDITILGPFDEAAAASLAHDLS